MTFDARAEAGAAEASGDYEPFGFIGLDGETYELPNALTLTERQLAAIRRGDEAAMLDLIGPDAFEALQDLPMHISLRLGEAWMEDAGEPGKSPSPSRATRRAAPRSKRTSRSAAST